MGESGTIQSYNYNGGNGELINNQKFSHFFKRTNLFNQWVGGIGPPNDRSFLKFIHAGSNIYEAARNLYNYPQLCLMEFQKETYHGSILLSMNPVNLAH